MIVKVTVRFLIKQAQWFSYCFGHLSTVSCESQSNWVAKLASFNRFSMQYKHIAIILSFVVNFDLF
jgi:hypothetical protein